MYQILERTFCPQLRPFQFGGTLVVLNLINITKLFHFFLRIHNFQKEAARHAGVFHHLITLPTYHTTALSTDMLARNYFSDMGMLAYVQGVQRIEIRTGVECVKHQVNF